MEEKREQQLQHVSSQEYPDACSEDEISLIDLWRVLVRQWKLICAITGLLVLGAVAYVLFATPVYEAQAIVKPPESRDVEVMNIPGISQISSEDIFAKFTGNLKSSSLLQQFVDENPQFSSLQGELPNIKEGTKKGAGSVFVSLQGYDSKLVTDWVNGFILLAERKTIGDFFDGFEVKIANQKKEIQDQLQIGRDFACQRRLDRIALLEDQIAIARASKIFDRKLFTYTTMTSQGVGANLVTAQEPLYMRGVKELTAEKAELENRKNDEPFIDGFREKQENLAQLEAGLKRLQAAKGIVRAIIVDKLTTQPVSPVKSRWKRVLGLSLVMGGIIGFFAACVVNFVQQQKEKTRD